jgi:tetratricopeptide (TPR) repeat protein
MSCGPNVIREPGCIKAKSLNVSARHFLLTLPDSAFQLANQSLRVSETESCVSEKAESHQIIGMVLFHQGVYQESLRHLLRAYLLFDELTEKVRAAETLNQLGLVYYNIKQPDLARDQHQQALALYEELKDEKGIALTAEEPSNEGFPAPFNFHLQAGSPALSGGNTSFSPYNTSALSAGGKTYSSPAPAGYFGTFSTN